MVTHAVYQAWGSAMAEAQEVADIEDCLMVVYEERREKEGRFFHVRYLSDSMPEEWSIATRVEPNHD